MLECAISAASFHQRILDSVFGAPMYFFDTTPSGRLLNRFSTDIEIIDVNLPQRLIGWLAAVCQIMRPVFIISCTTPIFIPFLIPVGIMYWYIQRCYMKFSRESKRIEAIQRSPIFCHFGESLEGLSVIRAYKAEDVFIKKCDGDVESNQKAVFTNLLADRWLNLVSSEIGALVVLLAGIICVLERGSLSPGLIGNSLSSALVISVSLDYLVLASTDLETSFVAVERVTEYTDLPSESKKETDGCLPASWPSLGQIEIVDYSARYRPGLDLVLKDISCHVKRSEKVGIVGRTGAGKSSLTLGLFRLIEPAGGAIIIDGVDITSLSLFDLRSKLTIIPQDPVIFSGTLRLNLDPYFHHTDEELWKALGQAHLKDFVKNFPEKLDHICIEGGLDFSVGQRQLVCLARALLRKTRVLVLDEATAAVDMETDEVIQETIRTEFRDCTILTIAHRLHTILDYDKILVLDFGRVVEHERPAVLLKDKNSMFFGLAKNAGLV